MHLCKAPRVLRLARSVCRGLVETGLGNQPPCFRTKRFVYEPAMDHDWQLLHHDPAGDDGSDASSRGPPSSNPTSDEEGPDELFSESELERDEDMGVRSFWLSKMFRQWTSAGRNTRSASASRAHLSRQYDCTEDLIRAIRLQLPRNILEDACNGEMALRLLYERRLSDGDKRWVQEQRDNFDNLRSLGREYHRRLDWLLSRSSKVWVCRPTTSPTYSAMWPATRGTSSRCAACTTFCSSFRRMAGSNTRSGTTPSLRSGDPLHKVAGMTALGSRSRMWRRWRPKQSVPKRRFRHRSPRRRRSCRACLVHFTAYIHHLLYGYVGPPTHPAYVVTPEHSTSTWPGPKSRRGDHLRTAPSPASPGFYLRFLGLATRLDVSTGVRVGLAPTARSGVAQTKLSGDARSTFAPGTTFCMHASGSLTAIRKRAFRRAIKRAQSSPTSSTLYRGRRLTIRHAAADGSSPAACGHLQRSSLCPQRSLQPRGRRLRVCSYNVGALDTSAFDSLMLWLQTCHYDVFSKFIMGWGDCLANGTQVAGASLLPLILKPDFRAWPS